MPPKKGTKKSTGAETGVAAPQTITHYGRTKTCTEERVTKVNSARVWKHVDLRKITRYRAQHGQFPTEVARHATSKAAMCRLLVPGYGASTVAMSVKTETELDEKRGGRSISSAGSPIETKDKVVVKQEHESSHEATLETVPESRVTRRRTSERKKHRAGGRGVTFAEDVKPPKGSRESPTPVKEKSPERIGSRKESKAQAQAQAAPPRWRWHLPAEFRCVEQKIKDAGWAVNRTVGMGFQGQVLSLCPIHHDMGDRCDGALKISQSDFKADLNAAEMQFAQEAGDLGVGPRVYTHGSCADRAGRKHGWVLMHLLEGKTLSASEYPYNPKWIYGALDLYWKLLQETRIRQADLKGLNLVFDSNRPDRRLYLIDYGLAKRITVEKLADAVLMGRIMLGAASLLVLSLTESPRLGDNQWKEDPDPSRKARVLGNLINAANIWLIRKFPTDGLRVEGARTLFTSIVSTHPELHILHGDALTKAATNDVDAR